MSSRLNRRTVLTSIFPAAAVASEKTVRADAPPRPVPPFLPPVPRRAFKAVVEAWYAARDNQATALAALRATPSSDPSYDALERAFDVADARFLDIERGLLDMVERTVGHGSLIVDGVLLSVATQGGEPGSATLAVADLARIPTL